MLQTVQPIEGRTPVITDVGVLSRHWTYHGAAQEAMRKRRLAVNPRALYKVRRRRRTWR
jgi:hypothetical protein